MEKTLRKYIPIVVLLIMAVSWLIFWRTLPAPSFSLSNKPLISVHYLYKGSALDEKKLEKAESLSTAGQILSIEKPDIRQAELVVGDNISKFADYNLIFGSGRDQFFSTATIKNAGNDPNNFMSTILEDKLNQKFLTIYPDQTYQIYLRLENDPYYLPSGVIINNVRYPITVTEDDFYKVSNFQGLGMTSVGIKPENDYYNISEAVFITDSIKQKNAYNRFVSLSTENPFNQSGDTLNIDIAKNNFVLFQSNNGSCLIKNSSLNFQPLQITSNSYANSHSNIVLKIDMANSNALMLIYSGGVYNIKNIEIEKRLSKLIIFSLLLIISALCIYFWPFTSNIIHKLFCHGKIWSNKVRYFFQNKMIELLIVGALMLLLLMLQSSSANSDFLTTTNLFVILFLLLLSVIKYDIKYLVPILILLTIVEAVFYQLNLFNIAEKAGKLLFSLMLVIIISILLSKNIINNKNTNEKY